MSYVEVVAKFQTSKIIMTGFLPDKKQISNNDFEINFTELSHYQILLK